MKKWFSKSEGSVLIGVLVGLVILSMLGIALIYISTNGLKIAVFDRNHGSAYFVAESGINNGVKFLESKAEELSRQDLSHEEFRDEMGLYVSNYLSGLVFDDFKAGKGEQEARAEISAEVIDFYKKEEGYNYSDYVIKYQVSALGEFDGNQRELTSVIEMTHRLYDLGGLASPIFDYAIFQGGTATLTINHGTNIEGPIYSHDFDELPARAVLNSDIVSLTDIAVGSNTTINGNVFAYGMYGSSGNVLLKPAGIIVNGQIHAKGDVIVSAGTTVRGNVFSAKDIKLYNSHTSAQGIQGNAFAGRNITTENATYISGEAYAGGSINLENPANVNLTPPLLLTPNLSANLPLDPPELTNFTPGTSDRNLQSNTNVAQTVEPGKYKELKVNWNNRVRFISGNYYFDKINANQSSVTFQFDLSAGPVNIYVKDTAGFGDKLSVEVSENGVTFEKVRNLFQSNPDKVKELAGKVYTEIHNKIEFASTSPTWLGNIYVNNFANLGHEFFLVGSVASRQGEVDFTSTAATIVYAPPSDSAAGQGKVGNSGENDETEQVFAEIFITVSEPVRER